MHWIACASLSALLGCAAAAQERDYVIGFTLDGQPVMVERKGQKIEIKRDGKPLDPKVYSIDGAGRVYRFVDRDGDEAAVLELDADGARLRTATSEHSAPRLGVTLGPVDGALAEHLDLAADEALQVEELVEGFPAQKAGIRKNDVITAIDGGRPVTMDRVHELIGKKKWGDSVAVEVARKSGTRKIDVKLERPKSPTFAYQSLLGDYAAVKQPVNYVDLQRALTQIQQADKVLEGLDLKETIDKAVTGLKGQYDSRDLEQLRDTLRKSQVEVQDQLKVNLDKAKVSLQGLDALQGLTTKGDWRRYYLNDATKNRVQGTDLFTNTKTWPAGQGSNDVGDKLRQVETRIERIEKKLDQVLKGLQKND